MLADDFGVGEEVKAAFAQMGSGDLEVLRPLLRERALAQVGDEVLAGLIAQEVLVDLASRTMLDFETAADLGAWLAIRVPQTAALFLGALVPIGGAPPPLSPRPSAWRKLWTASATLPSLASAAALASLVSASVAVALTASLASGPAVQGPSATLSAPPQAANSPRVLPSPTPAPSSSPGTTRAASPAPAPVAPSRAVPVSVSRPQPAPAPPATSPSPSPTPTSPPPPTPPPTSPPPTSTPPPAPSPACEGRDQGPPPCVCPGRDGRGCHCPGDGDDCHPHPQHPACGQPTANPPTPSPDLPYPPVGCADRPGS